MKKGIAIWLIKEWNKTAEKVYKRLYTKLNRVVPAGQFTSTSVGDVNHPTLGHKTKFQWGDPEFQ